MWTKKEKSRADVFFLLLLLASRLPSQSAQSSNNFDWEDERRALREELEKYREENETLRNSLRFNRRQLPGNDRDILTTASLDSGLETNTLAMSSTFLGNTTLQSELNECRQRERKLEEKIHLLNQVREINSAQFAFTKFIRTCFHSNFNHQAPKPMK